MSSTAVVGASLPPLVALWVGLELGPVETACLASAVRQGHSLTLYCYGKPAGVPRGVTLADAASILPESAVIRYPNGSPALFADRFRYELLRRGAGIWTDCDAYFLKPLECSSGYLYGWEDGKLINNGVIGLPSDSPILAELLAIFDEEKVPPWLPLRSRTAASWRLARSGRTGVALMPWGTSGPRALSWLLARHGLQQHALERDVLYPVPWRNAGWIFDPSASLDAVVTQRTVSVHLWTSQLDRDRVRAAKPGSFMAKLISEAEAAT